LIAINALIYLPEMSVFAYASLKNISQIIDLHHHDLLRLL